MSTDPLVRVYYHALAKWLLRAERDFIAHPTEPDTGYYGTGYRHWGYQAVANFASGFAQVAKGPNWAMEQSGLPQEQIQTRALQALRFFLRTHTTGDLTGRDGTQWGTDWISGNLFLRGIRAIDLLWDDLDEEMRQRSLQLLESEAEYLLSAEIVCNRWPEKQRELGRTNAEANAWNGSTLLHAAMRIPHHPHRDAWWEKACRYFINTLSVPQDAHDETLVDGKPVREWYVGPNLHPNFSFEHHNFLHFGYMAISLEELVFTWAQCRKAGVKPPESLFHHWQPVWDRIKRAYVRPGRLGYLAGEDWPRYVYCQAYFLSMLPGLQQFFRDGDARLMEREALEMVLKEQKAGEDGSFCLPRMAALMHKDPVALFRVESDYPGFISRALGYYEVHDGEPPQESTPKILEANVSGHYHEADARFILHREQTRLAAFSWAASPKREVQGTILPPGGAHLLEWERNLSGSAKLAGFNTDQVVVSHCIVPFEKGFATSGTVNEGRPTYAGHPIPPPFALTRRMTVVALPDGHTVLWTSRLTANMDAWLTELRGFTLNLANDLFNGHTRTLQTQHGPLIVQGLGNAQGTINTASSSLVLPGGLALIACDPTAEFHIVTSPERNADWSSLLYNQICLPYWRGTRRVQTGETLEDTAILLITGEGTTRPAPKPLHDVSRDHWRAWTITGANGITYLVVTNPSKQPASLKLSVGSPHRSWVEVSAHTAGNTLSIELNAGEFGVFELP